MIIFSVREIAVADGSASYDEFAPLSYSISNYQSFPLPIVGEVLGYVNEKGPDYVADVVKEINKVKKDSRIVMLTGYGNLPTAVAAVKSGAIDYMAKPVDADDVEAALLADPESKAKPPENPMSADRVKWEHIHRVFELCNRNVSETARRLKMHLSLIHISEPTRPY